MKIGFTGTQNGMTQFQKDELRKLLSLLQVSEFVHGDCMGSDGEANQIALEESVGVFSIYPSTYSRKRAFCFNSERVLNNDNGQWSTHEYEGKKILVRWYPKDTPLNRNRHIVDNVSRMIATPKEHEHTVRSGTWATIRYCWKTKRDITIIPPMKEEL
jgi:hypothetical protein